MSQGRLHAYARNRSARHLARAVVSLCVGVSLALAPVSAEARCLPSDEICGVPLATSGLDDAAPDIEASSGLVITADGRVIWARDASSRRAVASITKVMTALVVLERADLDSTVTVSEAAAAVPYATGLLPGERRTVGELLELALVASSNDAAHALAENVGGSVPAFASMMNDYASRLGLADSHFVNPHGLDVDGHYSSAEDVATIARAAMDIPEFERIVSLATLELPAYRERPAETIESTDDLLGTYDGLLGIKTGFTDDAKYCFVSAAERDGIEVTTVVLGAGTSAARFAETSHLLDWAFEHLQVRTIATTTETVASIPVALDPTDVVPVRFAETTSTLVFDLDGTVTRSLSLDTIAELPVFEGQPMGTIEIVQGDRVLASIAAVAAKDLASVEETVGEVPVADYLDRTVVARASGEPVDVPEFDPERPVHRSVLLDPHVSAPVEMGDQVGFVTYEQDGATIVAVPIVAAEEIDAPGTLQRVGIWFGKAWRWMTGQPRMASPRIVDGAAPASLQ